MSIIIIISLSSSTSEKGKVKVENKPRDHYFLEASDTS